MAAIKEVTYTDETGKTARIAYVAHPVSIERERFCRLVAYGQLSMIQCYCEAFGKEESSLTPEARHSASHCASRLMSETDVILRIQALRRPLVRKLQRKFEYTIQKAFEECEVAYDLAYATGDTKSLLAAIKLKGEFGKLLSQQIDVNHRYGLLDDASTETLLAMRREIEVRQGKEKKLRQIESVEVETVSDDPGRASFSVS